MRTDVRHYCHACLGCASRSGQGHAFQPPLKSIHVGGPFRCVGVDVLQLPLTYEGNQCAIVFMDYLTKWPEVFPSPDQKAESIARLLVEHVVARHGVPEQLLSDRGPNFLSELLREVCTLLGIEKINTSAYHRLSSLCYRSASRSMGETGMPIYRTCCTCTGFLSRSLQRKAHSFFLGVIQDYQRKQRSVIRRPRTKWTSAQNL